MSPVSFVCSSTITLVGIVCGGINHKPMIYLTTLIIEVHPTHIMVFDFSKPCLPSSASQRNLEKKTVNQLSAVYFFLKLKLNDPIRNQLTHRSEWCRFGEAMTREPSTWLVVSLSSFYNKRFARKCLDWVQSQISWWFGHNIPVCYALLNPYEPLCCLIDIPENVFIIV